MTEFEPYPYELHNGRELEMMLAGDKPLAVFVQDPLIEKADALGQQNMSAHVESGALHESTRTYPFRSDDGQEYEVRYWLYASAAEAWRIPAYYLLLDMQHHWGSWSPELECLQGTLLGYTDAQNRYHLSRTYSRQQ